MKKTILYLLHYLIPLGHRILALDSIKKPFTLHQLIAFLFGGQLLAFGYFQQNFTAF